MDTGMERHRENVTEDGGRGWTSAPTIRECRGLPAATRRWTNQRRILPSSFQREHGPANTLISDLEPSEVWENTSVVLSTQFVVIC